MRPQLITPSVMATVCPGWPIQLKRDNVHGFSKYCRGLAIVLWAFASVCCAQSPLATAANLPEPIHWGQDLFLIPYKWNSNSDPHQARQVKLFLSQDHGRTWQEISTAKPEVQYFTYHAPGDGEYWFSIQTIDATGRALPAGPHAPELRVIVDTQNPQVLALTAALTAQGHVTTAWEASDAHLDTSSVRLQYRTSTDSQWQDVPVTGLRQPTPQLAAGQTSWQVPPGTANVWVRLAVRDKAGNTREAGAEARVGEQLAQQPLPALATNATRQPAPQTWPRDGETPVRWGAPQGPAPALSTTVVPPAGRPPTEATDPFQFPEVRSANAPTHSASASSLSPPDLAPARSPSSGGPFAGAALPPAPPAEPSPLSGRPPLTHLNSLEFEIGYEIDQAGTFGVTRVELWATTDNGQSWKRLAVDNDNRSPIRAAVPREGLYGLRIVVETAGGLEPLRPRPGDRPEMLVHVDTTPPVARLTGLAQGEGYFADHLIVTWEHREPMDGGESVSIGYSSQPAGPWTGVATNLPHNGRYAWRLGRHLPRQFYVRLEVRDQAGNVAVDTTAVPVAVHVPTPTGRLQSARPLGP